MSEKGNKQEHIVQGMPWAEIVSVGIVAVCLFWAFWDMKRRARVDRIEKQVEEYAKTLPGYLEQKQNIARYRDSLMNVKAK